MPDFNDLIAASKKMSERMKETQEAIKKIEVIGVSGGDSVKITMNGEGEIKKIFLADSLFKEPKEILEDLIVAAHNDAKSKLKKKTTDEISKDIVRENTDYLVDQTTCELVFYREKPIMVEMPTTVDLQVTDTPPAYKGDTASGGGKPATLETGIRITVPMFVAIGEKVRVDTRNGEYVTRVTD